MSAALTLIPIGPLTNIALLLALHPDLPDRIERIVLMGGAIGRGQRHAVGRVQPLVRPRGGRTASSPRASRDDGRPRRHPPRHAQRRPRRRAARHRAAGALVADLHAFYRRFHAEVYGHDDTPVHDALAVAHVIAPDVITTERLNVEIDVTQGPCRGRTVVDQLAAPAASRTPDVALDVDAEGFIELLCERIG